MTDVSVRPDPRSALLLVDIQHDFLPGGALAVEGGDVILDPVRDMLLRGVFPLAVASQDWHPPGHASFASSHPGHRVMETIELHGHPQRLWPDHCVQGSRGAELHPAIPWERIAAIVRKGSDAASDSYSAFRNNFDASGNRQLTGLAGYLRERGVERLYLCGLARDYCVKWSAEDAAAAGFTPVVLWDLTRPVDPSTDGVVRAELERAGVQVMESAALSP